MKVLLTYILLLLLPLMASAQTIKVLSPGIGSDSSYYHLTKIGDNEYWTGGKQGVLKKIDTLGNISPIHFENRGERILKIEKIGHYVFLATSDATIYRYDLKSKTFYSRYFSEFKDKCFYDLIALDDGQLVVCGGNKAIVQSQKRFPKGIIAIVDQDLTEMKLVWKSYRKFVWSLLQMDNGDVLAAVFNGHNSKILKSKNLTDWKRYIKVRGLVYELALLNGKLCYAGARNFNINQNGILGEEGKKQVILKKKGFQWALNSLDGDMMTVSSHGSIFLTENNEAVVSEVKMPSGHSLYDIEEISPRKYLIVGKGQAMYLVDFNE